MNRPAHVSEWDNMIVVDLNLKATDDKQLIKLNAMIEAAAKAQIAASKGNAFASYAGLDLALAAFAFFETDCLKTLCDDIAHTLGADREIPPLPRVTTAVRKLDPSVWGNVDE